MAEISQIQAKALLDLMSLAHNFSGKLNRAAALQGETSTVKRIREDLFAAAGLIVGYKSKPLEDHVLRDCQGILVKYAGIADMGFIQAWQFANDVIDALTVNKRALVINPDIYPEERGDLCSVTVVLLDSTYDYPSVYLVKRVKGRNVGMWESAGGKIDKNETSARAAFRELKEEMGLAPETLSLVDVKYIPSHDHKIVEANIYLGVVPRHQLEEDIVLEDTFSEGRWFPFPYSDTTTVGEGCEITPFMQTVLRSVRKTLLDRMVQDDE